MTILNFYFLFIVSQSAAAFDPLQALLQATDSAQVSPRSEDSMLSLISEVDQERRDLFSNCAGFSYLLSRLYEREGLNISHFTALSSIFLGDLQEFGTEVTLGQRRLPRGLGFLKDSIREVLSIIFKIHGESEAALERPEIFFAREPAAVERLKKLRDRAFGGRWPWAQYPWLTSHGGEADGGQSLQNGYVQEVGDDDKSGRHDHLIAGLFLGRLFESHLRGKVKNSLAWVTSALLYFHEFYLPPRLGHGPFFERPFWNHTEFQNSHSILEPIHPIAFHAADLMFRAFNWASSFYSVFRPSRTDGIVGSPTDALMNIAAFNLGRRMEAFPMTADEFDEAVFEIVCDESAIQPRVQGPLSPKLAALKSIVRRNDAHLVRHDDAPRLQSQNEDMP